MSLETRLAALATTLGNAVQADRVSIGNLASLTTTEKASLVGAINEIDAAIAAAGVQINDAATNATEAWSSSKIASEITAAITAVIDGAPGAIDTLNELAAALGDDPNFAASIAADLANRVRFDAAQTLTSPQQAQAIANIGTVAASDIGNTDQDLVAVFTTALGD